MNEWLCWSGGKEHGDVLPQPCCCLAFIKLAVLVTLAPDVSVGVAATAGSCDPRGAPSSKPDRGGKEGAPLDGDLVFRPRAVLGKVLPMGIWHLAQSSRRWLFPFAHQRHPSSHSPNLLCPPYLSSFLNFSILSFPVPFFLPFLPSHFLSLSPCPVSQYRCELTASSRHSRLLAFAFRRHV